MIFSKKTLSQYTESLAAYLPNDRLFEAKHKSGSNLRSLLEGIASEVCTARDFVSAYDLYDTGSYDFLDEWERELGIPDDCFSGQGTNEERTLDLFLKHKMIGVQTVGDFQEIALLLGYDVLITNGIEKGGFFTYKFPIVFFSSVKEARFTMIVEYEDVTQGGGFPYTFPIIFGEADINKLQCIFNKVKPANVNLIFINRV